MSPRPAPSQSETERAFADAMHAAGFTPGPIQANTPGFVRFDAPGDKKSKGNGFYKLKLGEYPVGWFGDWKTGEQHQWTFKDPNASALSADEKTKIRREQARLRAEAAQERETRQAEITTKAASMWAGASLEIGEHPYLATKSIAAPIGLRRYVAADGAALLAVPMYAFDMNDEPHLTNLQLIGPDGSKRFLAGGRVEGCFFSIRGDDTKTIVICEGVATAFSISQATGFSVVAAFNSGNLPRVAKDFSRLRPQATFLIAGDDDAVEPDDWAERGRGKPWENAGRKAANNAANAIDARATLPRFFDGPARSRTDFNDLHQAEGLATVRTQIQGAVAVQALEADLPPAPANDVGEVSEDTIALAFTRAYRDTMRFDHDAGRWYRWDGSRWGSLSVPLAFHYAREIGRRLGFGKRATCKASVAGGAEKFARSDPAHAVPSSVWDRDPWLLGTPSGTIELRTGRIREPRRDDHLTKITGCAVDRDGSPDRWLRFLDEATAGDEAMQVYLQRIAGYCLTGVTTEHALFFVYGSGGNGKSVFLNILAHILGDYAMTAPMDTFTSSKFSAHPTELAMLKGARLVSASETEEGRAWAESRIKSLTGGDAMTARFMRQDFFTFDPQMKLLFAGNHQPALHSVDPAMQRRFNMVPFVHKPIRPDHLLEHKLREEAPAILGWAIQGCLDWQAHGLGRPESVATATADYFANQDLMGQWIDEACEVGERLWDTPAVLFRSWSEYAKRSGEEAGSAKVFGAALDKRGFRRGKSNGLRKHLGIAVRQVAQPD